MDQMGGAHRDEVPRSARTTRSIPSSEEYLQNVQFDVESAYAQWGMNLNVSAQVSNVTNSASVENPDPEIDIVARINAGWLFQSFGRSAYFRAKGSQGIWFQRWGEN